MILPIVAYGHPVLKAIAAPITPDYPELDELLANMWETLAHSEGVGLAAPPVNKSIRRWQSFLPRLSSRQGFQTGFHQC